MANLLNLLEALLALTEGFNEDMNPEERKEWQRISAEAADIRDPSLLAESAEDDETRKAVMATEGAFKDGYTSDGIDCVLETMSDWTGLDLVAVWDYVGSATGGDSNLHCLDQGRLRVIPREIWDYLNGDPDSLVDPDDLKGLEAGEDEGPCPAIRVGMSNYCYERRK